MTKLDDSKIWDAIWAAKPCDSADLIDALRWRGSRAYLVVSIAGYNRIISIGKALARAILKDNDNPRIRGLEWENNAYLITDGVYHASAARMAMAVSEENNAYLITDGVD